MFAALFPELTGKELAEAEAAFDAHLAFVLRLYNRISGDPETLAQLRAALDMLKAAEDKHKTADLTGPAGRERFT